jgi:hypothetical protein
VCGFREISLKVVVLVGGTGVGGHGFLQFVVQHSSSCHLSTFYVDSVSLVEFLVFHSGIVVDGPINAVDY